MYDLDWSRSRVEDLLVLSTRGQLTEREFDALQDKCGFSRQVKFADALAYCLAASQGAQDMARLWNRLKRVMKKPPACAKPVESDLLELYLIGARKGRVWTQKSLFEQQLNALDHLR